MDLDHFLRRQADVLQARRLLVFLLWSPLLTVPATILIDLVLLGSADMLRQRSYADVVLVHLPGLANLYPLYRVIQLGRLNRALLSPVVLGLISYVMPNLIWFVFITSQRSFPLVVESSTPLVAVAESNFGSFVLWCLTLSVLRGERE